MPNVVYADGWRGVKGEYIPPNRARSPDFSDPNQQSPKKKKKKKKKKMNSLITKYYDNVESRFHAALWSCYIVSHQSRNFHSPITMITMHGKCMCVMVKDCRATTRVSISQTILATASQYWGWGSTSLALFEFFITLYRWNMVWEGGHRVSTLTFAGTFDFDLSKPVTSYCLFPCNNFKTQTTANTSRK